MKKIDYSLFKDKWKQKSWVSGGAQYETGHVHLRSGINLWSQPWDGKYHWYESLRDFLSLPTVSRGHMSTSLLQRALYQRFVGSPKEGTTSKTVYKFQLSLKILGNPGSHRAKWAWLVNFPCLLTHLVQILSSGGVVWIKKEGGQLL